MRIFKSNIFKELLAGFLVLTGIYFRLVGLGLHWSNETAPTPNAYMEAVAFIFSTIACLFTMYHIVNLVRLAAKHRAPAPYKAALLLLLMWMGSAYVTIMAYVFECSWSGKPLFWGAFIGSAFGGWMYFRAFYRQKRWSARTVIQLSDQ